MIQLKRVYEEPEKSDGKRFLLNALGRVASENLIYAWKRG